MPNNTLDGQLLDTVGIELESIGLSGRAISAHLGTRLLGDKPVLTIARDASTESYMEYISVGGTRKFPLYYHTQDAKKVRGIGNGDNITMGYEIIINPLEIPQLETVLSKTLLTLSNLGDFESERAAVHFHVGFGNNLRYMKKLLRVCLKIDPFLFRLGGMGGTYRGNSNQSAYARPLLYPCVVPIRKNNNEMLSDSTLREVNRNRSRVVWNENGTIDDIVQQESEQDDFETASEESGKYAKIINVYSALDAETIRDFWASFGVFPDVVGLPKYHPTRYTACNFYAIAQHGTMEFRHFNQSLNPRLIFAIAKFLRATVEMSTLLGKFEVNDFSIDDSRNQITMEESARTVDLIMRHCREKEIENLPTSSELNLIMDTVEASTFKPLTAMPVKTHIREFYLSSELAREGKLEFVDRASNPKQIDIHTINNHPLVPDQAE